MEGMTASTFDCNAGQVSQLVARVGETGNERVCLTEGQMERQRQLFAAVDAQKFKVKGEADAAGGFCVGGDTLSVTVGESPDGRRRGDVGFGGRALQRRG